MTLYDKSDFTPLLVLYLYCKMLEILAFSLLYFTYVYQRLRLVYPINLNLMGMSYVTKNSFGLPEKKKRIIYKIFPYIEVIFLVFR